MIQYIHKKNGEKKNFTDHHNTSVQNVHTERTMCRGGGRGGRAKGVISSDPQMNPLGGTAKKKKTIKIV